MVKIAKADIRAATGELYDESEFELWFASPQALLDGATPAQLVALGRGAVVLRAIRSLEEGVHP